MNVFAPSPPFAQPLTIKPRGVAVDSLQATCRPTRFTVRQLQKCDNSTIRHDELYANI